MNKKRKIRENKQIVYIPCVKEMKSPKIIFSNVLKYVLITLE